MVSRSIIERQSGGSDKSISMLDSRWIYKGQIPIFHLPNPCEFLDEKSLWIDEMNDLISYYSYLLTCPSNKFWSEVKFQGGLSPSVSSFLERCPRTLRNSPIPRKFVDVVLRLHSLVLMILKRASQPTESETIFLRNSEHDEIIYQSGLFDLSSVIDVAVLYGNSHSETVRKIFASLFTKNSKFISDAVSIIHCAVTALSPVEKEVVSWQFNEKHQLTAPSSDSVDIVSKTIEYVVEAGCNLGAFLSFLAPVNSSVADLCIRKGVVSSLAKFYDSTILSIQDHILRCVAWSSEKKSELLGRLAIAAASLVKTVRVGLIEPGLVNRIMQLAYGNPSASSSQVLVDTFNVFIDVTMEMLNYHEFTKVYALLYPLVDDINLVREATSFTNVDKDQLDYLQGACAHLAEECSAKQANFEAPKRNEETEFPKAVTPAPQKIEEPQPGCSRSLNFRMLKAVLPDIEDDLLERCLEYYNDDTQATLTALLDGSVPLNVSNPEICKPTENFNADQLWQGKRQNASTLQPLSTEDKDRVLNLSASVWDDEDVIGDSTCGGADDKDDGKNATVNRMNSHRGVDLTYDDEYDDTFDGQLGVDIERTEEDEVEETELAKTTGSKLPNFQPSVFLPRGNKHGNHQKHRYRQEPPMQQHRQQQRNVLQIENPEDLRQRRQCRSKEEGGEIRAVRKGRLNFNKWTEVPSQSLTEPSPSSKNSEVNDSITQTSRGVNNRGRPHGRGRGGFSTARGRGRPGREPNAGIKGAFHR